MVRASLMWAVLSAGAAVFSPWASADCPLRIIHTNDLHSHLEHSNDPDLGSYAAVKATIDSLKADARARGIPTLTLDAGDFTEGSEFYLADRGTQVFRIMNEMGYDAVTIGNHDWLMGLNRLDQIVGAVQPSFAFLGANFVFDWAQRNLTRYMHQWAEFRRGDAKIAVLGLTTSEVYYSWRVDQGFINDPVAEAAEDLPDLRRRNDFVIALTHLGVNKDRNLVQNTREIDLVVGGHSHTRLDTPVYETDHGGKQVAIVQTGQFGEFVGDLLVDACPGKPLRVISYRLVPVKSSGPRDAAIDREMQSATRIIEDEYGAAWWNEPVGFSSVELHPTNGAQQSEWSDLAADAFREAGQADIAIDLTVFEGLQQPAGPILRKQIVAMYPHIFEFDNKYGWSVWTSEIRGAFLRFMLNFLYKHHYAFSVSGMTLEVGPDPADFDNPMITSILVNGQPLEPLRDYKIALPEGAVRGALSTSGIFSLLFGDAKNTRIPIWSALENRIRGLGTVPAYTASSVSRIRTSRAQH